jgi:hypothetical protein
VLSESPFERNGKWETRPILKEDRLLWAFSWRICDKTATLLGVRRAPISKVMLTYTNHGKTTPAKMNSGWKPTLTKRDRHWEELFRKITELLQHRWQQNRIFILKTLFPHKLSDVSFTNPKSTVELQLLNLWLLKVMLRCVNDGVTTMKLGHQTSGNARMIWSDESSFPLFPTSNRKSLRLEDTQGSLQSGMRGSNSETRGRFCHGLAVVSWYNILLVPLLPITT